MTELLKPEGPHALTLDEILRRNKAQKNAEQSQGLPVQNPGNTQLGVLIEMRPNFASKTYDSWCGAWEAYSNVTVDERYEFASLADIFQYMKQINKSGILMSQEKNALQELIGKGLWASTQLWYGDGDTFCHSWDISKAPQTLALIPPKKEEPLARFLGSDAGYQLFRQLLASSDDFWDMKRTFETALHTDDIIVKTGLLAGMNVHCAVHLSRTDGTYLINLAGNVDIIGTCYEKVLR